MIKFQQVFKRHYPYAAPAMCAASLAAPDPALFLLVFAAAIALMPCAFADEVDDIARAVRRRKN